MMSRISMFRILIACLSSGCQTVEQAQQAEARRQVEKRYAEERVLRLQGELMRCRQSKELRRELISCEWRFVGDGSSGADRSGTSATG